MRVWKIRPTDLASDQPDELGVKEMADQALIEAVALINKLQRQHRIERFCYSVILIIAVALARAL